MTYLIHLTLLVLLLILIAFQINVYVGGLVTLLLLVVYWCSYSRLNYRLRHHFNLNISESLDPGFEIIEKYNISNVNNIFCMSLYGNNPKYYKHIDGIISGIEELNIRFNCEFQLRIYLHDQVSDEIKNKLISSGIQVYIVRDECVKPGNSAGAFWRFTPLHENVRFICIDADDEFQVEYMSRLISKWEESEKLFMHQVLPTHFPWPKYHIAAGFWGADLRYRQFESFSPIYNYKHRTTFGADETYLFQEIFPLFKRYGFISIFPNKLSWWSYQMSYPIYQKYQNQIYSKMYL